MDWGDVGWKETKEIISIRFRMSENALTLVEMQGDETVSSSSEAAAATKKFGRWGLAFCMGKGTET